MPRRLYVHIVCFFLHWGLWKNLFFLPALFPQVGRTGGVVLAAKLTTFFTGVNCGVVKYHACCQHADGTNLYYLHRGSDICLFHYNGPPLPLASPPLYGEKLPAALVGVWLLLFYFFYHSPPEALPIEGELSEGLRGSFTLQSPYHSQRRLPSLHSAHGGLPGRKPRLSHFRFHLSVRLCRFLCHRSRRQVNGHCCRLRAGRL